MSTSTTRSHRSEVTCVASRASRTIEREAAMNTQAPQATTAARVRQIVEDVMSASEFSGPVNRRFASECITQIEERFGVRKGWWK